MALSRALRKNDNESLGDRIRDLRATRGFTRNDLAEELGISAVTIYRWETGTSRPSSLAVERLEQLGIETLAKNKGNDASIPKLKSIKEKNKKIAASNLRENSESLLNIGEEQVKILPSSWVRNGPPDQNVFHSKLLSLQEGLAAGSSLSRLSMVEAVNGEQHTSQHQLERPTATAVAWNSNYGSHGWHRYVGRFPPHVVRAILNYFNADEKTVVCDPFAGSGTTAVECRLLGIPFIGIEICPLSCLMTRTKACFPEDANELIETIQLYGKFYHKEWQNFLNGKRIDDFSYQQILARAGNHILAFPNVEKWFTKEALLGVSLTVQFGLGLTGYPKDAVLLALSAKMRSIGNVDVDVVRAEYSKRPRTNVDVCKLVTRQLQKMSNDIKNSVHTHTQTIGNEGSIKVHEGSVLDVDFPDQSIDHIVTSPPYGIEAISYLRTHLLSYHSLRAELKHDPYEMRDKTIGGEYLPKSPYAQNCRVGEMSATFSLFFNNAPPLQDKKMEVRRAAMIQFFEDLLQVAERMSRWLKDDGRAAFIIGNKRLGDDVIPTNSIIIEMFNRCGFDFDQEIKHKLKTNNSNSQVPWQARIIQEESILLFRRRRRAS